MEWDNFKNQIDYVTFPSRVETDIKCPNCGRNIFMRTDITLTSYPEQYQYECTCGWSGTAYKKWRNG